MHAPCNRLIRKDDLDQGVVALAEVASLGMPCIVVAPPDLPYFRGTNTG